MEPARDVLLVVLDGDELGARGGKPCIGRGLERQLHGLLGFADLVVHDRERDRLHPLARVEYERVLRRHGVVIVLGGGGARPGTHRVGHRRGADHRAGPPDGDRQRGVALAPRVCQLVEGHSHVSVLVHDQEGRAGRRREGTPLGIGEHDGEGLDDRLDLGIVMDREWDGGLPARTIGRWDLAHLRCPPMGEAVIRRLGRSRNGRVIGVDLEDGLATGDPRPLHPEIGGAWLRSPEERRGLRFRREGPQAHGRIEVTARLGLRCLDRGREGQDEGQSGRYGEGDLAFCPATLSGRLGNGRTGHEAHPGGWAGA